MNRKPILHCAHRWLIPLMVLAALLLMMIPASVARADEVVVEFPDPGLEAAIRDAIPKQYGDIYQSDLDLLTWLNASGRGIIDLTGLEHCTSLTGLNLPDNQLSDISALLGLTNLTWLNLMNWAGSNHISDLTPLRNLTNLTYLNLARNGTIGDLTGLESCTALTELDLQYNQVGDLTPLANLTNLTGLNLWSNQVGDLTPLRNLTRLTGDLNLAANQIGNLTGLENCTGLTSLNLQDNQLSDISAVSGLTNLISLHLGNWAGSNHISDLTPLRNLTNLTYLNLARNGISDLTELASCSGLTALELECNQVSDLSPLSGLTSLTGLALQENQISDISPLSSLTNLTGLVLFYNQISDLTGLEHCTSLTYLNLAGNQISDLSPLSGLTNLTALELHINQIGNLSPLSGLTNLTGLALYSNQISNLSPLSDLTNLSSLTLSNNQVGDIEALVNNPGMGLGDVVYLHGNPLNSNSVNTWIPTLQDRGVAVYWDTINQIPDQPGNVSPTDGAADASLTPTLQSSAFSDSDVGDAHAASQWQITMTAGAYSSPIFDSGSDASNLTSIAVPSGILGGNTTYYWHVRYRDSRGDWSDWSAETSFATAIVAVPATIHFDPSTLNLKSKGNYVTVYIELPAGYNVGQIGISSILLNGTVPAMSKPAAIGDYDKDGIPDLMVKFDRAAVQGILSPGDQVQIAITGQVGGLAFKGSDTIRVIH